MTDTERTYPTLEEQFAVLASDEVYEELKREAKEEHLMINPVIAMYRRRNIR